VAPSLLGRCALDGHSHLPRTLLLPATHTMDCSLTKRWEQAPKICAFSFVCMGLLDASRLDESYW
jgi:hypothetical protein